MSSDNSVLDSIKSGQEEYRIRRYNNILEGINQIFSKAVQAKTKEELGNVCLTVALKVTGSLFGFVGEVGADGLLRDVVISNMGWNRCTMYDKTGHRRLPGDFVLHGLYGYVIDSGKSFFTNDPSSHPNSIGLPQGHPPLTSFLSVPLILDGKTVGIISVANREGGYSLEQQVDLEAIALAVTQALRRKREEQEHLRVEAALRESEDRYRILLDSIDEGFCILKKIETEPEELKNFRYIEANPAFEKHTGLKNILGKTILDLVPEAEQNIIEIFDRVALTGEPIRFEAYASSLDLWADSYAFRIGAPELRQVAVIFRNVTKRKRDEENLKKMHENLEDKIRERTNELEKTYNSLKENERSLSEAQRMAHVGNWARNLITNEVHWSDEVYRIFGFKPQEFGVTYSTFLSHVHPGDQEYVKNATSRFINRRPLSIDYRIISADGKERIVHEEIEVIFDKKNTPVQMKGTVQDITERKKNEEFLVNLETARQKEIHHRIKNNLQVISSLLDLQCEQFKNKECIQDSEVSAAFREIQNRVISIALIHEELHKGEKTDSLNFSLYLQRLVKDLYEIYRIGNPDINLIMELEEDIFFDMDAAVPLGMIVNELVSNSFKYAFKERNSGEIQIKLYREESKREDCNTAFVLIVSDNGVGIPENIDIENLNSLGLQLVTTLVEQLDGELELKKNNGTKFTIRFNVTEKNNQELESQQLADL